MITFARRNGFDRYLPTDPMKNGELFLTPHSLTRWCQHFLVRITFLIDRLLLFSP